MADGLVEDAAAIAYVSVLCSYAPSCTRRKLGAITASQLSIWRGLGEPAQL